MLMSNYWGKLDTDFSNNKYKENQHKYFEYGLISGAWAGDWNMPHYQLFHGTYKHVQSSIIIIEDIIKY